MAVHRFPYDVDKELFERLNDGRYWVPMFLLYRLEIEKTLFLGFLPKSCVTILDFIDEFGKHKFPDDWNGMERYSKRFSQFNGGPTLEDDYTVTEFDSLMAGNWSEAEVELGVSGRDKEKEVETEFVPVSPLELSAAAEMHKAHTRLVAVFSEVRNHLYSGEIIAWKIPDTPHEIPAEKWGGDLWDKEVRGYSVHSILRNNPMVFMTVYFKKCDIQGFLDDLKPATRIESSKVAVLSPYIQAAIHFTEKYKVTEESFPAVEDLESDILENWPLDCGKPSKNKAKKIARVIRWPSHESGGNKSNSKINKG